MHKWAAAVEENAPEKIETVYSSEHDRQMSQATMRVIRHEQTAKQTVKQVPVVAATARAARGRERRPVARRRPSRSPAGDDDPPGEQPAARGWRRYVVDNRFCVVSLEVVL